jgi:hypothetical protein
VNSVETIAAKHMQPRKTGDVLVGIFEFDMKRTLRNELAATPCKSVAGRITSNLSRTEKNLVGLAWLGLAWLGFIIQ